VRRVTYALENSPLTAFGISHLLVLEKMPWEPFCARLSCARFWCAWAMCIVIVRRREVRMYIVQTGWWLCY